MLTNFCCDAGEDRPAEVTEDWWNQTMVLLDESDYAGAIDYLLEQDMQNPDVRTACTVKKSSNMNVAQRFVQK